MTKQIRIEAGDDNRKQFEEFADRVGLHNGCCGCHNRSYEVTESFTVIYDTEEKKDDK